MPYNDPPWNPITNSKDLKNLGKLNEELGECIAAVSRCIIQGLYALEPTTNKPNNVWLEEEIADVIANISLVSEHFGLNKSFIMDRAKAKISKLKIWHNNV